MARHTHTVLFSSLLHIILQPHCTFTAHIVHPVIASPPTTSQCSKLITKLPAGTLCASCVHACAYVCTCTHTHMYVWSVCVYVCVYCMYVLSVSTCDAGLDIYECLRMFLCVCVCRSKVVGVRVSAEGMWKQRKECVWEREAMGVCWRKG